MRPKNFAMLPLITFCLLIVGPSRSSLASDAGKNSRQGFVLSFFGLGGPELLHKMRGSITGGVGLGYGVTEDLIIYADSGPMVIAAETGLDTRVLWNSHVNARYYPWKGLFANLGAGAAVGYHTVGPSAGGSVGYEFRFGKMFYLSPEGHCEYIRQSGTNLLIVGGGLELGLHF